jgi:hypothetical protein
LCYIFKRNQGSTAELVDQICHVLILVALQSQTIPTVQCFSCFLSTHNVPLNSFLSAPHRLSTATIALCASVILKVCPAVCLCFCCYGVPIATDRGTIVQRVQEISFVPRFSYGRGLLRDDDGPNRVFFTFLFATKHLPLLFCKEVKLIRSEVIYFR